MTHLPQTIFIGNKPFEGFKIRATLTGKDGIMMVMEKMAIAEPAI